jgi:hypothetical protein
MRWPWQKRETRSHSAGVTQVYIDGKRKTALHSEGYASLSATIGTAAGLWSRSFAMLVPDPSDVLTPDHLAAIGLDLFFRGQSVWHIDLDHSGLQLRRAAFWDMVGRDRWSLTLPQPNGTDTVKALGDEVLSLTINASPETPWQGRSPLAFMGLASSLMADIEATVAGALPWAGKGLLPIPMTVPAEQKDAALAGLRTGYLATVYSKEDHSHHTGGAKSEFKRVDLTPELARAGLTDYGRDLHSRILAACGIPPGMVTDSGNAGAIREQMRAFALTTLDPLSRMITPELSRKIGVTRLGLQDLMSADVAGRARAVGSLVQSGVPLATAMSLVGWDNVPLPDGASKPIPHGGE